LRAAPDAECLGVVATLQIHGVQLLFDMDLGQGERLEQRVRLVRIVLTHSGEILRKKVVVQTQRRPQRQFAVTVCCHDVLAGSGRRLHNELSLEQIVDDNRLVVSSRVARHRQ
jgi:hypothetical protein